RFGFDVLDLLIVRGVGLFVLLLRRVFLGRAHALNDQEAEAIVGQSFEQRSDAHEERRAKPQIADGLARLIAAAGDESAKEVDGSNRKRKLSNQFGQVRLIQFPLVSKDRFQKFDLRSAQTGEPLRQLFRIGVEKHLSIELTAREPLQK